MSPRYMAGDVFAPKIWNLYEFRAIKEVLGLIEAHSRELSSS
jgi:hypothetical protein